MIEWMNECKIIYIISIILLLNKKNFIFSNWTGLTFQYIIYEFYSINSSNHDDIISIKIIFWQWFQKNYFIFLFFCFSVLIEVVYIYIV